MTTGTDIYSMGVVLYFVLAGRSPYRAKPEDSLAMMQEICVEEPPPPSTVTGADGRALRGPLDAIVLRVAKSAGLRCRGHC